MTTSNGQPTKRFWLGSRHRVLRHRVRSLAGPMVRRPRRISESKACHAPLQAGHPVTTGYDILSTTTPWLLDRPVKPGDDTHLEAVILRGILSLEVAKSGNGRSNMATPHGFGLPRNPGYSSLALVLESWRRRDSLSLFTPARREVRLHNHPKRTALARRRARWPFMLRPCSAARLRVAKHLKNGEAGGNLRATQRQKAGKEHHGR